MSEPHDSTAQDDELLDALGDGFLGAGNRPRFPEIPRWARVANVPDVQAALGAWKAMGLDRGPALPASRETPRGLLEWRITVRDDGQRLLDGCLPTLIQWGDTHPAAGMPESGVCLQSLSLTHPQADTLATAFAAIGLEGVAVQAGEANLCAQLHTPRGLVKRAMFRSQCPSEPHLPCPNRWPTAADRRELAAALRFRPDSATRPMQPMPKRSGKRRSGRG